MTKVFHFLNNCCGGVFSVVKNLLKYSSGSQIENHVIFTINKDIVPDFILPEMDGAVTQTVFYYSAKWNFYYTCKQLAKLLPDEKAVVVAHDWLELGMMSNLGLQNPVVLFVHGAYSYYYQLAQKHEQIIDLFIPVSESIEKVLKANLPSRTRDIRYLRFPVPDVHTSLGTRDNNIVFIGRLSKGKGYNLLPKISRKLKKYKIQWHIFGQPTGEVFEDWDQDVNVTHYGNVPNDKILSLLPEMKIILLPSLSEGMPVSLIEAMKAGVIPIASDIPGGIQELILHGETGFKVAPNSEKEIEAHICTVLDDLSLALTIQKSAIAHSNYLFEPIKNTAAIENEILHMYSAPGHDKKSVKIYGSRLDHPLIPNIITSTIRILTKNK